MKPKYDDLSIEEKEILLDWIADGLWAHAKQAVGNLTYMQMVLDMQGTRTFSIEGVYDQLHEKTVGHIAHAARYQEIVEEERSLIRRTLSESKQEDTAVTKPPAKRKRGCKK